MPGCLLSQNTDAKYALPPRNSEISQRKQNCLHLQLSDRWTACYRQIHCDLEDLYIDIYVLAPFI